MKNFVLLLTNLIASSSFAVFTPLHPNSGTVTIKVTSEKPTKFDMWQDGKWTFDLATPYELKVENHSARFLFKVHDPEANKYSVGSKK